MAGAETGFSDSMDEAAVALRSLISNCSKPDAAPARMARSGSDGIDPRAQNSC
jgi:hypothetical protein